MDNVDIFYKNVSYYMTVINNKLSQKYTKQPLSNKIKVLGGYAFKSSEYLKSGIPIVRISDFNNEKIELSSVKYYTEKEELQKYELFPGDIIIAMTGGTIGKLAIVQEGLGKLYLNQRVAKFKVLHEEEFIQEYVYWLMQSVKSHIVALGYGGAQPNVSVKQIEAIKISFPPKEIQIKIIEFLRDLKNQSIDDNHYFDSNIENTIKKLHNDNIKINTIKNNSGMDIPLLKSKILDLAVRGELVKQNPNDESAEILYKKIQEEKEKLTSEGKIKKQKPLAEIKEELPYNIPKSWKWVKLENIGEINPRNTLDRNLEISFIPMTNVSDGYSNKCILNNKLWKEVKDGYTHLKSNDVIMAKITPCFENRKSALLKDLRNNFGAGTTEFHVFRSWSNYIYRLYILWFFKSPFLINTLTPKMSGSAGQKRVSTELFKSIKIPLPPVNEQQRIVEKVEKLMALCDELENKTTETEKLSSQLLNTILSETLSNTQKTENTDNVDILDSITEEFLIDKSYELFTTYGKLDHKILLDNLGINFYYDPNVKNAEITYTDNKCEIIYSKPLNNFDVIHEVAHIPYHKKALKQYGALGRKNDNSLDDKEEAKVNTLTAKLLLPDDFVFEYMETELSIKQQGTINNRKIINQLSKRFGVSFDVAKIRLQNLGYKIANLV